MDAAPVPTASPLPHAVPLKHALSWFESALRTFKRQPWRWCALGFITLASQLLLTSVPGIGVAAAAVIVPVVGCGMLLAAAALDRGGSLEIRFATAAFAARPAALAAIVVAALFSSAIEAIVAYALTGANLLADSNDAAMNAPTLLAVVGAETAASLPFVFVPMAVLLQNAAFGPAFLTSVRAFALNVAPLMLFGLLTVLLTVIGLSTFGIGLIAVYPLLVLVSYAAWKDICSIPTPP